MAHEEDPGLIDVPAFLPERVDRTVADVFANAERMASEQRTRMTIPTRGKAGAGDPEQEEP